VIDRRVNDRVPAAYITNEAWLGSYKFYVDERTIVPRSFIAELIPEYFAPWVNEPENVSNILELCTGSGCLAIMMADAFPTRTSMRSTFRPMRWKWPNATWRPTSCRTA
jgi:ribosomal protein L3 glutamine methyltransferase